MAKVNGLERTLAKIDATLARINTHPEYSAETRRETDRLIFEEAAKHSNLIELECKTNGINGTHGNGKERGALLQNLKQGWEHLAAQGITLAGLATLPPGSTATASYYSNSLKSVRIEIETPQSTTTTV